MITISETFDVPASPSSVWTVLSDPQAVVTCIAGAELGQTNDDGSFNGSLMVKFGPLRIRFSARIELELDAAEMEGRLHARGKDAQGGTRVSAHATFTVAERADGAGSTVLCSGEVELSGKLASVVEAGATTVVRRMSAEFAQNLSVRCGGDGGRGPAPVSAPAPNTIALNTVAPNTAGSTPLPDRSIPVLTAAGTALRDHWTRALARIRSWRRRPS